MTNPRDAFRGQSRSPNIVPFHMLGIAVSVGILMFYRNFVPKTNIEYKNKMWCTFR